MGGPISGEVAAGFGPLADAFARNFADSGEDAAAVAVYHQGGKVVGLWAALTSSSNAGCPRTG